MRRLALRTSELHSDGPPGQIEKGRTRKSSELRKYLMVRRCDVILSVVEEVAMTRANAHRFGAPVNRIEVGWPDQERLLEVFRSTQVPSQHNDKVRKDGFSLD